MNTKKTYEHLITEKLETELPIPEMADAIWARIKVQLDADTDVETVNTDTVISTAKSTTVSTIAIVAGCLIAVVMLFFLIKKSGKKKSNGKEKDHIEQSKKQHKVIFNIDSINGGGGKVIPYPNKQNQITPVTILGAGENGFISKKDSATIMLLPLSQKDTVLDLSITPNKLPALDSVKAIIPLKKPRGVPMGSNDYKIQSVKKDST